MVCGHSAGLSRSDDLVVRFRSAIRDQSVGHWLLVLGIPALVAGVVAAGIAVAPSGYDERDREVGTDRAVTVETSEPPAPETPAADPSEPASEPAVEPAPVVELAPAVEPAPSSATVPARPRPQAAPAPPPAAAPVPADPSGVTVVPNGTTYTNVTPDEVQQQYVPPTPPGYTGGITG